MTIRTIAALAAYALLLVASPTQAQTQSIVVASTTSTQDSGLFGHILPLFKAASGIDVRVVAQGTGQALDTGRRGDADALFVHAKAQEEKFVADGFGVKRFPVMYNDFVLIGPKNDLTGDPAASKAVEDVIRAVAVRGIKVVMATHDLGSAKRLAGEVMLLHRGRIVETADTATFFANPATHEARSFVAGELLI